MDGKKIKLISIISILCATMLTADLAAMQQEEQKRLAEKVPLLLMETTEILLPVCRIIAAYYLGSCKVVDIDQLAKKRVEIDIIERHHGSRFQGIPGISISLEGERSIVGWNLRFPIANLGKHLGDQLYVGLFNESSGRLILNRKGEDCGSSLPLSDGPLIREVRRIPFTYTCDRTIKMPENAPQCSIDDANGQWLLHAEVIDHDKERGGTQLQLITYEDTEYQIKKAMLALQAEHDEKQKAANEKAKLAAAQQAVVSSPASPSTLAPADHGDHKGS